ncbi:MAG: LytR/AlgR family response regulator transcription factor [Flavobacteriales bacterium]|jgi:two-component system response regulator LytT
MISAIIIEDEQLVSDQLKLIISSLNSNIKVEKTISSVPEALEYLKYNDPDLIFLDVNINEVNSLSYFEDKLIKSKIIITTAYSEFAINSFSLNTIDYLIKPITKDKLEKSLIKYAQFSEGKIAKMHKEKFLVKLGTSYNIVFTKDISYFVYENKYTTAVGFNGKKYLLEDTLLSLEEELNPNDFLRINRKFLISIPSILKINQISQSRLRVHLTPEPENNEVILVSIDRIGRFKKWLNK